MPYLPKFKQSQAKYTPGQEFRYADTQQEYSGMYFVTSRGEFYSGESMKRSFSRLLVPYSRRGEQNEYLEVTAYDIIKKDSTSFDLRQTAEVPKHIPVRNEATAFTLRYFAQRKSDSSITEISVQTYEKLKNKSTEYHYPSYNITFLKWYTYYPVEDSKNGSYIIQGSKSKNREEVNKAERVLPGISEYLSNLSELVG